MQCCTQALSNSCISVFRGWMSFIRLGEATLLSLNEPRARRTSVSSGMRSWPWKRWYPTTWRWDPSSHLWDHWGVTCLSLQLAHKEEDTALPLRKMFCPPLILPLLKAGEGEIRISIPYSRFLFLRAEHSMSVTSMQAGFPHFRDREVVQSFYRSAQVAA